MSDDAFEPDYLVIGAGATALAFVDSVLTHSKARVVMVDGHDRPGGHWGDAYPFVRLHQPSDYYGVNSMPLGRGARELSGLNAGMRELASGAEVLDYFDRVMRERLLPSGRVAYFPRHWATAHADGAVAMQSLVTGATTIVRARTVVDGTLARTEVPSTHPPRYAVAAGVTCVPINALPTLHRPGARYTVVGSGKTGIDAVLWLLDHGVDEARIRWIIPRDAWMLNRANYQLDPESFEVLVGGFLAQMQSVVEATSVPDLFRRLESRELLVRLDTHVEPTAYKCCTVSPAELRELRRVTDVVRLGHVEAVHPHEIELTRGRIPLREDEIVVDCSACAVLSPPPVPVFAEGRINLLMIRICQPTFSGAMIGLIASLDADLERRNVLVHPVPSPNVPLDWLRMWNVTIRNRLQWSTEPAIESWMRQTRLDSVAIMSRTVQPAETAKQTLLMSLRDTMVRAGARLPELLATAG